MYNIYILNIGISCFYCEQKEIRTFSMLIWKECLKPI